MGAFEKRFYSSFYVFLNHFGGPTCEVAVASFCVFFAKSTSKTFCLMMFSSGVGKFASPFLQFWTHFLSKSKGSPRFVAILPFEIRKKIFTQLEFEKCAQILNFC